MDWYELLGLGCIGEKAVVVAPFWKESRGLGGEPRS